MYRRILVPLDGSKLAEIALIYAEELGRAFSSEVTLMGICEPAESQYLNMQRLYIEKLAERVKSHAKGGVRIKVESVSLIGEPPEEIIKYAKENGISLTIMTTHGRSGIMPRAMGSTADRVLRRTSMPILLIRAEAPTPRVGRGIFSKILVPLDGSDTGEVILPYIEELAGKLDSAVILFQAVAPGQHVHTVGGLDYVSFTNQQVESMRAEAQVYLEKVGSKLTDITAAVKSEVRIGDAAREVINFADEMDAGLVAVSSHGHSSIKQWVFGSVTHKILQAGNKSVLLVKAPGVKG
jgi:nucleotide-binding universal stress UspA family protein